MAHIMQGLRIMCLSTALLIGMAYPGLAQPVDADGTDSRCSRIVYQLMCFNGSFTQISETTYAYHGRDLVFLYDTRSGRLGAVTLQVYEGYRHNMDLFGAIIGYYDSGEGRYGIRDRISYFRRDNGEIVEVREVGRASLRYEVFKDGKLIYRDYINREPEWEPRDPASVDWSQARYRSTPGLPGEKGGALIVRDGASVIIIKATEDHKPVPGARAYRSLWLGRSEFLWRGLHGFTQFDTWSDQPYYTLYKEAVLGVPVAKEKIVVQQGVVYLVQRFENGTAQWELPINPFTGEIDPFIGRYHFNTGGVKNATITLTPQAQAAYDAWVREHPRPGSK
ncbi:MAG: hypothetical protein Q4C74_06830 [Rothia sp. (in: high G+C Gram-positive bacteria)]|nr:hypothetical protein [Rothia sp. (in: high G+C Gram-positive bacteria)]